MSYFDVSAFFLFLSKENYVPKMHTNIVPALTAFLNPQILPWFPFLFPQNKPQTCLTVQLGLQQ